MHFCDNVGYSGNYELCRVSVRIPAAGCLGGVYFSSTSQQQVNWAEVVTEFEFPENIWES